MCFYVLIDIRKSVFERKASDSISYSYENLCVLSIKKRCFYKEKQRLFISLMFLSCCHMVVQYRAHSALLGVKFLDKGFNLFAKSCFIEV